MQMKGLFAAVPTPTRDDGRLDMAAFDRLVDFLVGAEVDGICVGGATGEYSHFETTDRKVLIRRAADRLPRNRSLLVGIGAPSIRHVIELGETAIEAGSRALLLPMPMFFRYEQEDLQAFCIEVSRTLRAPCLLYDLPEFTNALSPATVVTLLEDEEFIVGIKDSSGRVENLVAFATARDSSIDRLSHSPPARSPSRQRWTLLVGDDRLLHEGLRAGWDGGISGAAGFWPELPVALYRSFVEQRRDESLRLQAVLDELLSRLAEFPTPWGIRIGLAARGFDTGPLPLPLTAKRQQQIGHFRKWLRGCAIPHPNR